MGILDLFKPKDINQGVNEWKEDKGAILLDVRTVEEYKEGRVPGSKNLPLSDIAKIASVTSDKDDHLYVYCLSGGRSMQAVGKLQQLGYKNVKNIGGISNYKGTVEK